MRKVFSRCWYTDTEEAGLKSLSAVILSLLGCSAEGANDSFGKFQGQGQLAKVTATPVCSLFQDTAWHVKQPHQQLVKICAPSELDVHSHLSISSQPACFCRRNMSRVEEYIVRLQSKMHLRGLASSESCTHTCLPANLRSRQTPQRLRKLQCGRVSSLSFL